MFKSRLGFTLAEVLITLGIIGIVASMTIPTLTQNFNERSWETASTVFNKKLGEALKVMNSQASLAGFTSTKDFVDELAKHYKIIKTCDSTELNQCFIEEISTTGDAIETSKLKAAKNLYSVNDYGTETIGVVFADGTTALIAYNPNTHQDPYSNQVIRITGGNKNVNLNTDAISILYDINGLKAPNSYGTGKDIRGLNISIKTGASLIVIENYTPVDCTDSSASNPDYKYCTDSDKEMYFTYATNYWAGAKKACAEQVPAMRLPEIGAYSNYTCSPNAAEDTLCGIFNNKAEYDIPSNWFWSATDFVAGQAWVVNFSHGGVNYDAKSNLNFNNRVLCVD